MVALLVMFAFTAPSAKAGPVTFGTVGTITCTFCTGSGTSSARFGTVTDYLELTLEGILPSTVNANPFTFASLGSILASSVGNWSLIGPGVTFQWAINQVFPGMGTAPLSGILLGQVTFNSSTGLAMFGVSTVTIAGVEYTVNASTYQIVPSGSGAPGNEGRTTFDMTVTDHNPTPVPELPTLFSGAAGLLAFGTYELKRHRLKKRLKNS